MAVTDPALVNPATMPQMPEARRDRRCCKYGAGIAGALLVLVIGKWIAARRGRPGAAA